MRILITIICLFYLNALNLKSQSDKNISNSKDQQSYYSKDDILKLQQMIGEVPQSNKHTGIPKLDLPSLFPKQSGNKTKEHKLSLPNNVSSSIHSDLKCCGIEVKVAKPQPKGHYEKVIKKVENYFWVNGPKPSGMPGAFVVSHKEAKSKLGIARR